MLQRVSTVLKKPKKPKTNKIQTRWRTSFSLPSFWRRSDLCCGACPFMSRWHGSFSPAPSQHPEHHILTLSARILPLTGNKNCHETHFWIFFIYIYTHMPQLWYMKRGDVSFIKTPSKWWGFFETVNELMRFRNLWNRLCDGSGLSVQHLQLVVWIRIATGGKFPWEIASRTRQNTSLF